MSRALVASCVILLIQPKGDVTRDDSQQRFLAQRMVAMLEQCCNYSKQCHNNVATMLQRCVAPEGQLKELVDCIHLFSRAWH